MPSATSMQARSAPTAGSVISRSSSNEALNITLQEDFNPSDPNDNPFSYFPTAIEAAYFWLNGEWPQRDHFDFWVIDTFTFIASVFLTIILQNLLIAFMR